MLAASGHVLELAGVDDNRKPPIESPYARAPLAHVGQDFSVLPRVRSATLAPGGRRCSPRISRHPNAWSSGSESSRGSKVSQLSCLPLVAAGSLATQGDYTITLRNSAVPGPTWPPTGAAGPRATGAGRPIVRAPVAEWSRQVKPGAVARAHLTSSSASARSTFSPPSALLRIPAVEEQRLAHLAPARRAVTTVISCPCVFSSPGAVVLPSSSQPG